MYVRCKMKQFEWGLGSEYTGANVLLFLAICSGSWFHTQSYASRIYMYEQGVVCVFYDVLVWKRRALGSGLKI